MSECGLTSGWSGTAEVAHSGGCLLSAARANTERTTGGIDKVSVSAQPGVRATDCDRADARFARTPTRCELACHPGLVLVFKLYAHDDTS